MAKNKEIKITFLGAAGEVTGSNHLLEIGGVKILLDCGMFQGGSFCEQTNYSPFLYDPESIDYVLLSHAHIDHSGRIPKLYRNGFRGTIYCTSPTQDIAKLTLLDSANILAREAKDLGLTPYMSKQDVLHSLFLFKAIDYFDEIEINKDIKVKFVPAGHILGSAMIIIEAFGKRLLYTGDLGNSPSPLIQSTYYPEDIDYIITESTYGDRNHIPATERRELLLETITKTIKRKGVLMIPSFAVERTQELLYDINQLVETKILEPTPIYLDSPLAINVTHVYESYQEYFSEQAKQDLLLDDELFNFPGLSMTYSTEQSKKINKAPAPKVILAGSGMSIGGRILHHEIRYLSDPNNTLLMVGFQVQGSLGRKLVDGYPEVKIHGLPVSVRAEIVSIRSYSAHADQKGILKVIKKCGNNVKKVFIVHGEPESSLALSKKIDKEIGVDFVIPKMKETIII